MRRFFITFLSVLLVSLGAAVPASAQGGSLLVPVKVRTGTGFASNVHLIRVDVFPYVKLTPDPDGLYRVDQNARVKVAVALKEKEELKSVLVDQREVPGNPAYFTVDELREYEVAAPIKKNNDAKGTTLLHYVPESGEGNAFLTDIVIVGKHPVTEHRLYDYDVVPSQKNFNLYVARPEGRYVRKLHWKKVTADQSSSTGNWTYSSGGGSHDIFIDNSHLHPGGVLELKPETRTKSSLEASTVIFNRSEEGVNQQVTTFTNASTVKQGHIHPDDYEATKMINFSYEVPRGEYVVDDYWLVDKFSKRVEVQQFPGQNPGYVTCFKPSGCLSQAVNLQLGQVYEARMKTRRVEGLSRTVPVYIHDTVPGRTGTKLIVYDLTANEYVRDGQPVRVGHELMVTVRLTKAGDTIKRGNLYILKLVGKHNAQQPMNDVVYPTPNGYAVQFTVDPDKHKANAYWAGFKPTSGGSNKVPSKISTLLVQQPLIGGTVSVKDYQTGSVMYSGLKIILRTSPDPNYEHKYFLVDGVPQMDSIYEVKDDDLVVRVSAAYESTLTPSAGNARILYNQPKHGVLRLFHVGPDTVVTSGSELPLGAKVKASLICGPGYRAEDIRLAVGGEEPRNQGNPCVVALTDRKVYTFFGIVTQDATGPGQAMLNIEKPQNGSIVVNDEASGQSYTNGDVLKAELPLATYAMADDGYRTTEFKVDGTACTSADWRMEFTTVAGREHMLRAKTISDASAENYSWIYIHPPLHGTITVFNEDDGNKPVTSGAKVLRNARLRVEYVSAPEFTLDTLYVNSDAYLAVPHRFRAVKGRYDIKVKTRVGFNENPEYPIDVQLPLGQGQYWLYNVSDEFDILNGLAEAGKNIRVSVKAPEGSKVSKMEWNNKQFTFALDSVSIEFRMRAQTEIVKVEYDVEKSKILWDVPDMGEGQVLICREGQTTSISQGELVKVGDRLTMYVIPAAKKELRNITCNYEKVATSSPYTFTVGAIPVHHMRASFDDVPSAPGKAMIIIREIAGQYTLRASDISVAPSVPIPSMGSVDAGHTVQLEGTVRANYEFDGLYIDSERRESLYETFEPKAGKIYEVRMQTKPSSGSGGMVVLHIDQPIGATIIVTDALGTNVPDGSTVEVGRTYSVAAIAQAGKKVKRITLNGNTLVEGSATNFVIPEGGARISAIVEDDGNSLGSAYLSYEQPIHGSLRVYDPIIYKSYPHGSVVPADITLRAEATNHAGYVVAKIVIDGVDFTGDVADFKTVAGATHTLKAHLNASPGTPGKAFLILEDAAEATIAVKNVSTGQWYTSYSRVEENTALYAVATAQPGNANPQVIKDGITLPAANHNFNMPGRDVTLSATATAITPPPAGNSRIIIHQPIEGGTIAVTKVADGATVNSGDVLPLDTELKVLITTETDYRVETLTVQGVDYPRLKTMEFKAEKEICEIRATLKHEPGEGQSYILTLDIGEGSILTVTDGTHELFSGADVFQGTELIFNAELKQGYQDLKLSLDGAQYTEFLVKFTMPDKPLLAQTSATITPVGPGKSRIHITQPTNGTISLIDTGGNTIPINSLNFADVPLDVELGIYVDPDAGYMVDTLTIDGVDFPGMQLMNFTPSLTEHTVTATLKYIGGTDKAYPLVLKRGTGTTLTVTVGGTPISSGQGVFAGKSVDVEAGLEAGYTGLTLKVGTNSPSSPHNFSMPTEKVTIETTANLKLNPGYSRIIIAQPATGGSIKVFQGSAEVVSGSEVPEETELRVEVTTETDYQVRNLVINGKDKPRAKIHTFTAYESVYKISVDLLHKPGAGNSYCLTINEAPGTTIDVTEGGVKLTSGSDVFAGTTLKAVAKQLDGYENMKLFINDVVKGYVSHFKMPEQNTVVRTEAKAKPVDPGFARILITQPSEGGWIVVRNKVTNDSIPSGSIVNLGTRLTVEVRLAENYLVKELKIGEQTFPGIQYREFTLDYPVCKISVTLNYKPNAGISSPLILLQGDGTTLTAEAGGKPVTSGMGVFENTQVNVVAALQNGHENLELLVDGTSQAPATSASFKMPAAKKVVESKATPIPAGDGFSRILIYQPFEGGTIAVTKVKDNAVVNNGDQVELGTELRVVVNTEPNYKVRTLKIGDRLYPGIQEKQFFADVNQYIIKVDLKYIPGSGKAYPLILNQGGGTTLTAKVAGLPILSGASVSAEEKVTVAADLLSGHQDLKLLVDGAEQPNPASAEFNMPEKRTVVESKATITPAPADFTRVIIYQPAEGGTISVTRVSDGSLVNSGDAVPTGSDLRVVVSTEKNYKVKILHLGDLKFPNKHEQEFRLEDDTCIIQADLMYIPGAGQAHPLILQQGNGTTLTVTVDGVEAASGDGVFVGQELVATAEVLAGHEDLELLINGTLQGSTSVTFSMPDKRTIVATKAAVITPSAGNARIFIYQPTKGGTIAVTKVSDNSVVNSGDEVPLRTKLRVTVNTDPDYRVNKLHLGSLTFAGKQEVEFKVEEDICHIKVDLLYIPNSGQSFPLVLNAGEGTSLTATADGKPVTSGDGVVVDKPVVVNARLLPGYKQLQLFVNGDVQSDPETATFNMVNKRTVVESKAEMQPAGSGFSRIIIQQPIEGGTITVMKVSDSTFVNSGDVVPQGTALTVKVNLNVDYAVEQLIINGEELGNIQERTFDADLNKYVIGAELKLYPGMGQSYPLILVQGLGSTLTAMAEGVVVSNGVGIFEGVEVYVKAEALPDHDSLELFIEGQKQASVELRFMMPSKRTVVESRAFPNDPTAGNSRILIYQPTEGGTIVVKKVADGSVVASGTEVPLGTELEVEVESQVDYFVKKLIISGRAYDSVQQKVFKADLPIYTITAELYKIAGAGKAYPLVLKQGSGTILTAKVKDKPGFLASGASVFKGTDLEIEAKARPKHEGLTLTIGGSVVPETKVEIQMPGEKTVVESTATVILADSAYSRILITQPTEGGQVRVFQGSALLQDGDSVKLGTTVRVEVLPEVDYFVRRILIGSTVRDSVQEAEFVADLLVYDITAELTYVPGAGQSYTLELLQGDGTILTAKADGKKLRNGAGVFEGTPVMVSAELISGFEDLKLYVNGEKQVISSATFDMPAKKTKVESKAAVKAPSPGYSRITVLQPTEGARIIVTKEADNTIVVSGTEVPLGTRLNIFVKTDLDYTVRKLTVGPIECGAVMDFTFSADLSSYIIKAELKHIPGAGQCYPLMLLQGPGTTLKAVVDGVELLNGAGVFKGKSVSAEASLLPGHENLALIVDGTKMSGSSATFVMLDRKMVVESMADVSAPTPGYSRILIYQPPEGGKLKVTKVSDGSQLNNGDEVPLGTELQVEVKPDVDYFVKKLMIGALSYNGVQLKKFTADLSKYAISTELLKIPGAGQSYPVALLQGNGTILTAQAGGRILQDGSGVFANTKVTATAKLEPGHENLEFFMDGVKQTETTATLLMPSKPLVVETKATPKTATPGYSRIFIYQPTEGGRIIVTQLSDGKQVYNGDEVKLGTALEVEVKSDVDYFVKKLIIGGLIYDSIQLKSFTADHVEYAITALLTHVPGAGQSYPLSLNQGFGTTLTATAGGNKLHNGAGVFEKTPVAVAAELLAGHEGLELFVDGELQSGAAATFKMPARRAVVESKAKVIAPTDGNSRILIYQPVEGGALRVTKVADGEEVKNGDEVPLGTALIVEVKTARDYRVKTLTIGDLEYSGIQYKAFTAEEEYYMITAVMTHIPGAGQSYPLHILAAEGTTLIVNDGAQDLADGQGVFENTTLTVKAELLIGYDSLQLFIDSVEQTEMTVTFDMPARAATVKSLASASICIPFIFEQPQGGAIEVIDRTAEGLVVASGEKVQAGHEVVVHVRVNPKYTFKSFTINGKEQEAHAVTIIVDPAETAYHIVLKVEAKPDNTPVESEALARVLVGPNPFTSQLHLLNAEGVTFYQLFDPHGVVVLQGTNSGETTVELPVERLAEGFYLLRLKDADGVIRAIRVVKQ